MGIPKQSLCLTVLSLLCLVGCARHDSARDIFERGRQKYDNQDWNGALADFTLVIQLEPNYAAYANRALAERQLNKLDDAIIDCNHAIGFNSTNSLLYSERGFLEFKKSNLDAAIADYSRAIELNPTDATAYFDREVAKRKKGDWDGAIADANKAIEFNPNYALAYNDRGWAEFQKNDFNTAIADATHSIQLDSTNGYAYGTRGWARYGKGDVAGAVEDCKKAIELSRPNSSEVYCDQGLLNFINDDYEKAIASWEKAIVQDAALKQELQPWLDKAKAKLQEKKP